MSALYAFLKCFLLEHLSILKTYIFSPTFYTEIEMSSLGHWKIWWTPPTPGLDQSLKIIHPLLHNYMWGVPYFWFLPGWQLFIRTFHKQLLIIIHRSMKPYNISTDNKHGHKTRQSFPQTWYNVLIKSLLSSRNVTSNLGYIHLPVRMTSHE